MAPRRMAVSKGFVVVLIVAGVLVNVLVLSNLNWNTAVSENSDVVVSLFTKDDEKHAELPLPDLYAVPKRGRKPLRHHFPKELVGSYEDLTGDQMLEKLLELSPLQNAGLRSDARIGGELLLWSPTISSSIRNSSSSSETQAGEASVVTIPNERVLPGAMFDSCAVVASSGGLIGSGLGSFIDSHDAVVRFNSAPVPDWLRADLGSRTTVRFINNMVLRNLDAYVGHLDLFEPSHGVVAWEACYKKGSLDECLVEMEKQAEANKSLNKKPKRGTEGGGVDAGIRNYFQHRREDPDQKFYLLSTDYIWQLWEFLQMVSSYPLVENPPSTGFLGVAVMLHLCDVVDLVEFVPSKRAQQQPCHYYVNKAPSGPKKESAAQTEEKRTEDRIEKLGPPCGLTSPGSGWHPFHMELSVMLRLAGYSDPRAQLNATSYNGVISVSVGDFRRRRGQRL